MKILSNFDRGITEILAEKVKANLSFKVRFYFLSFCLLTYPAHYRRVKQKREVMG